MFENQLQVVDLFSVYICTNLYLTILCILVTLCCFCFLAFLNAVFLFSKYCLLMLSLTIHSVLGCALHILMSLNAVCTLAHISYFVILSNMDTTLQDRSWAYATSPDFRFTYFFLRCRGTGHILARKQFLNINIHVLVGNQAY